MQTNTINIIIIMTIMNMISK